MKKFVLIGHPLGHSLSPQIHGAGYAARGLVCDYSLADCPDERAVSVQVERLRLGELAGANVTVPWKRFALSLADSVDPSARDTGAANVLARDTDGHVRAYNTDAPALAALLRAGRAGAPSAAAVVLGNGGAALAGVIACQRAGARKVFVTARSWRRETERGTWRAAAEFETLGAVACAWVSPIEKSVPSAESEPCLQEVFSRAQIVVQCTSAGMLGTGSGEDVAGLVPWKRLPKDACAYDVVYNPARTPFLEAAQETGLRSEGGLSMLVGQAALAFEIWLGGEAPRTQMRLAAEVSLSGGER